MAKLIFFNFNIFNDLSVEQKQRKDFKPSSSLSVDDEIETKLWCNNLDLKYHWQLECRRAFTSARFQETYITYTWKIASFLSSMSTEKRLFHQWEFVPM